MKSQRTNVVALAVVLGVFLVMGSSVGGATISYVSAGPDLSTGGAWQSTSVAKALDLNADKVYGTDGLSLLWSAEYYKANPPYATVAPAGGTGWFYSTSYQLIDNHLLAPAPTCSQIYSAVVYHAGSDGGQYDLATFTLSKDKTFRLGVMIDNADVTGVSPASLRVRGGSADTGLVASTAGGSPHPNYYFFDITGSAGDTFTISGVQRSAANHSVGIGALTFDSLPVALFWGKIWNMNFEAINGPTKTGAQAIGAAGDYWNSFQLPAWNTTITGSQSKTLLDTAGDASVIRFAWSTAGKLSALNFSGDPLLKSYIAFNAAGVLTPSFDWTISGLTPGESYDLYEFAADMGARDFNMQIDTNGDGVLDVTQDVVYGGTLFSQVRADPAGTIIGRASGIGGQEGDWAGFQLQRVDVPEPATLILLGAGLAGLVRSARRRIVKR